MAFLVFLFLMNFLRTLLIIAIIYYGFKIITKYVLPILIAKSVKNIQEKMENQYRQQNKRNIRTDGEVTIERNQTNPRNSERDNGDYIDFEEVD